MKAMWTPALGAMLAAALPVTAAAAQDQDAPAAQPTDSAAQSPDYAAKLDEAHAILEIVAPAAKREETAEKLASQFVTEFRRSTPKSGDAGIDHIVGGYLDKLPDLMRPVMKRHMPDIFEAEAVAYTHEFTLAELKDIHAFGQTKSGRHYLEQAAAITSDPAVQKANTAMIADAAVVSKQVTQDVRQKVGEYIQKHPEVLKKLQAQAQAQAQQGQ
jgi:hypothetical protein